MPHSTRKRSHAPVPRKGARTCSHAHSIQQLRTLLSTALYRSLPPHCSLHRTALCTALRRLFAAMATTEKDRKSKRQNIQAARFS
mmetsp:Transcript_34590/g.76020  ORF Transcript_34590/g.76020 Transcript_34590/m.76020 type:complete len:85 (+) Transcript_34590:2098-2352(+)